MAGFEVIIEVPLHRRNESFLLTTCLGPRSGGLRPTMPAERCCERLAEVNRSSFLQRRLKLRVNLEKSAVARPSERKFFGYSMNRRIRNRTSGGVGGRS
jgi:hypothetical protein